MNIDRPTQQLATQHIAPPLLMRYASEALEALAPNAPLLAVLVNEVVDTSLTTAHNTFRIKRRMAFLPSVLA